MASAYHDVTPPARGRVMRLVLLAPGRLLERVPRPLRFAAVGGACAVLQLLALAALARLGVELHAADALAFVLCAQVNFALNSAITWRDRRASARAVAGRLAGYNALALGSLAVNQVVFALALPATHYLIASALGLLAGALLNYTGCGRVIFRRAASHDYPERSTTMTATASTTPEPTAPADGLVPTIREALATLPDLGGAPPAPAAPVEHFLSLILPAHDEAENLEWVVRAALLALPRAFRDCEVVVVDDGSRDATPAIADALAAEDPRVRVVRHPHNRGYGAALRSGFAAARGDRILFMDADRQFDIREVARLAPFADEYDIVAGYRRRRRDPLARVALGATFNTLVRVLFGVRVRDIDCGFKLFRADLLRGLDLAASGALINTEILALARRRGATLVEVGVSHYPRPAGAQSGGSPRVVARALGETLHLWRRLRAADTHERATSRRLDAGEQPR